MNNNTHQLKNKDLVDSRKFLALIFIAPVIISTRKNNLEEILTETLAEFDKADSERRLYLINSFKNPENLVPSNNQRVINFLKNFGELLECRNVRLKSKNQFCD